MNWLPLAFGICVGHVVTLAIMAIYDGLPARAFDEVPVLLVAAIVARARWLRP